MEDCLVGAFLILILNGTSVLLPFSGLMLRLFGEKYFSVLLRSIACNRDVGQDVRLKEFRK